MSAYYNEIEPFAADWLRNLIAAGLIAPGDVDTRSIVDVKPDDLTGYTQCHFFAGIGGWSLAARLAGWPDDRPLWTGSCPCQPFSVAGRGKGIADERHLWPDFHRLIRGSRPAVVMGEQTSGAPGYAWLDGVLTDLEAEAYTGRAVDIPACSVNSPQIRNRLYWVARADHAGLAIRPRPTEQRGVVRQEGAPLIPSGAGDGRLGGASSAERWPATEGRINVDDWANAGREEAAGGSELAGTEFGGLGLPAGERCRETRGDSGGRAERTPDAGAVFRGFWDDWELIGPDPEGKYRRIKPGITPLDTRLPGGVGQIRGYGNAINPELAAEVILAYMETEPQLKENR